MNVIDEVGLPSFFESNMIHIAGLVVCEYNADHSHWNSNSSLGDWLQKHGIPAIFGVDTRMLTKKIREKGAMLGKLEFADQPLAKVEDPNLRNLVAEVSTKTVRVYNPGGHPKIVAIDCGMKYNIIRYLTRKGVQLTVVPYDHDFKKSPIEMDGLFISNGPGDPSMCKSTIEQIRSFIQVPVGGASASRYDSASGPGSRPLPVFGICLGNQLMALAAGAKTYKMKYGNRGMNQPCIDLRTTRCYITPQNHGFAVDSATLPHDWKPFFINANDGSNEGIIHQYMPFFSVQFHPEASGGPTDTDYLFDMFLEHVNGTPPGVTTIDSSLYLSRTRKHRKVLLLGSGGLSIGQAGEFDYSGSQAIKALKEEGIEVILINPNIATVQTSKGMADKVYFLPVTPKFVLEVIKKERPEGILISMGGQTALNVGLALEQSGDLQRYNVAVLGTPVKAVVATEDREIFSKVLAEIGESIALSYPATSVEEALKAANKIGYPVLIRAAYALGGLGSGFAHDDKELTELAVKAFASSEQILIDQDLRGWKEIEYEVVRDCNNNCITVCNMENFDPLGVHTGDSIVIAPSQTLTNSEYYMLRRTALKVVRHLGIQGECNIQYALHPSSEKYCIIEVNARLSRSSALASKATGYPLAYVAAKLALGHDLVTLRNSVTKTTTACFEPSLDYCVVKVPRWDLKKFGTRVDNKIGSAMKSVGEVMAIGRTFEEAIQKATRMVNPALSGFGPPPTFTASNLGGYMSPSPTNAPPAAEAPRSTVKSTEAVSAFSPAGVRDTSHVANTSFSSPSFVSTPSGGFADENAPSPKLKRFRQDNDDKKLRLELDQRLKNPMDSRLLDIAVAFEIGYPVEKVHELTKIDRWFLTKLHKITAFGQQLEGIKGGLAGLPTYSMKRLKKLGFSDKQIAERMGLSEMAVRRSRESAGIRPSIKQIDTLAAEFPASTNYLYMTYHGDEDDVEPTRDGVIVLGGGPYCIGSSVEFDWCAVSCVRTLRSSNIKTIMINCNPETVSTDYDESDRLYFDELTLERVLDIYEREGASSSQHHSSSSSAGIGVIVSVGGQIPNNLSIPLQRQGVRILGTSPIDIDKAEDRNKFSKLLDSLGVDQPPWRELSSLSDIRSFVQDVGFPVLIRPSYVLSGAAMRVAVNEEQLRSCLAGAAVVSPDYPVVVSKFIVNAKEIEFDAVAKSGKVLNYAISEHIENAGVHSGDATLVLPAQKLYVETIRQVKKISQAIAKALNISGPFNIQFMSRENEVKVIECNLRASRTFPFISKTFDFNFISLATKVMAGLPAKPGTFSLVDVEYVGIKAPQFSFTRLHGADPTLGVEMVSTGEVACFGVDMYEAFLLAIQSAGFKLPDKTRNILISVGTLGKPAILDCCQRLQRLGYNLFATEGTKKYLEETGGMSGVSEVHKTSSGKSPTATSLIQSRQVDLVINDPETGDREMVTDGYLMRRTAVDFGVSLITNVKNAVLLSYALEKVKTYHIKPIEEYLAIGASTP